MIIRWKGKLIDTTDKTKVKKLGKNPNKNVKK